MIKLNKYLYIDRTLNKSSRVYNYMASITEIKGNSKIIFQNITLINQIPIKEL